MKIRSMTPDEWKEAHFDAIDSLIILEPRNNRMIAASSIAQEMAGGKSYGHVDKYAIIGLMNPFVQARLVTTHHSIGQRGYLTVVYGLIPNEYESLAFVKSLLRGWSDIPEGLAVQRATEVREIFSRIPGPRESYENGPNFRNHVKLSI